MRIAKKLIVFTIKIALAAALLYWLFRQKKLDFSALGRVTLDAQAVGLLLAGAAGVMLGIVLLAYRLKLLLRFKRFDVSLGKATSLTCLGLFSGSALPGLVGGDIVKAAYLCGTVAERRVDALAAVVVDRVVGLYSLFVLATLALITASALHAVPTRDALLFISPAIVGGLTVVALVIANDGFYDSRVIRRLRSPMPRKLQSLVDTLRDYLTSPRLCLIAVALSVVNHGLVVVSYLVGAVLLHDRLPAYAHFLINPLAMSMNAVAVTPGGLGIAESAFAYLFQAAGSPNGAIIGLIGRFIQYAVFAVSGSIVLVSLRLSRDIGTLESAAAAHVPGESASEGSL